ncbi:MAG: hypothetical protein M1822_006302 [Bathelium mastoideum]|nr:MAG: hypothetical protein M1822_006302 [Bathelium mastoideum]
MAANQPSYMLAPNWDFPADGAIALGSLIKNPKSPHRALDRAKVDPAVVTTTRRSGWTFSRKDAVNGKIGIWASILAPILGVGGDVAADGSRDLNDTFKCDELETRYFVPDDAFIAAGLNSATVLAYTEKYWWKSIYMITGVKIAHRATMETALERSYGGETKVGVDGTSIGVPASGGSELRYEHTKGRTVKFGANDGFILAYQLLKIKPKKAGDFKVADYNKFALLGEGSNRSEEERKRAVEQLHELWDMEELKGLAGDGEGGGLESVPADELSCNMLIPKSSPDGS